MPPDFLNSREDSTLIWLVTIVGYAIYKDPRGIGGGYLGVLRALLAPKLVLLYGTALLYSALVVFGASELDLWHWAALKPTVYWFIGTAVVLVGCAVAHSPGSPRFLRGALKRVVAVTILVDFIVNLYVLPLAVELVLVFLALLFVGLEVLVRRKPAADPRVRKVVDWSLASIGLFCFVYFLVRGLSNLDGFLTRENAEGFLVGPALTVALISFLCAVAWLSQREQRALRERLRSASHCAS